MSVVSHVMENDSVIRGSRAEGDVAFLSAVEPDPLNNHRLLDCPLEIHEILSRFSNVAKLRVRGEQFECHRAGRGNLFEFFQIFISPPFFCEAFVPHV